MVSMMTRRTASLVPSLLAAVLLGAGGQLAAGEPALRLVANEDSPDFGTVKAVDLEAELLAQLSGLTNDDWRAIFPVYTGSELPAPDAGQPAVAGSYEVDGGRVVFRPRYPLVKGLDYTARFTPAALEATFALSADERVPSTVVSAVYPSGDELPENLLRLYLHFSAPMSRGEAYAHLRFEDADGNELPTPFVEIAEELWDPRMRRLTLFFDPGRIKRGLRPHDEVGPPLAAGGSYRLLVDPSWRDAQGVSLAKGFSKSFKVAGVDRKSPDPAAWRLEAPAANGHGRLVLNFPEPLDHGLLERVVRVRDDTGRYVAGSIEITSAERRWSFTPEKPWNGGDYTVEVESILEDVAGNNLNKVFDVDLRGGSQGKTHEDRIELPFHVDAGLSVSQATIDEIQRVCLRAYPTALLAKMADGQGEIPAAVDAHPESQKELLTEIVLDKGLFLPSLLENLRPSFEDYIRPDTRFLELGSGDGRVVFYAAAIGARSTGIEYDQEMVEVSEKALAKLDGTIDAAKVELLQGDFFEIPWSGYDVIYYYDFSSPEHWRVREKLLEEMDPGAVLLIGQKALSYKGLELVKLYDYVDVFRRPEADSNGK